MSNDKTGKPDFVPERDLPLYAKYLMNRPVGFPLKLAGIDQPGSLYRLKAPFLERKFLGKNFEGQQVPLLIILRVLNDDFIEVAPCWVSHEGELNARIWGPHDVLISGAASPYALPENTLAGHLRVLFWMKEPVFTEKFEKHTRPAAQVAANIASLLRFYEDEEYEKESELDSECIRYRKLWQPRWHKVLEKVGLPG